MVLVGDSNPCCSPGLCLVNLATWTLPKDIYTALWFKSGVWFYAAGFTILFVSRLITIIILAYSSKGTLNVNPVFAYVLTLLITPLVIYLFYSVKKYFTIERAYGIDHFDRHYSEPYVKQGIFKYTNNGMYVFGLMILYLPGLLLQSESAILAAIFNHVYIWVHYYYTERPDMLEIYGDAPWENKKGILTLVCDVR